MAVKLGTVSFLFTDLVGSTQLLEQLGDDSADQVRATHFRILRAVVHQCGGEEVKSLGDGLMVVFASAVDALRCAIGMQQAIHRFNSMRSGPTLRIRAGLHSGESMREERDYFGRPVVIAKRLCDQAAGDQILVSELTCNLIGSRGGFQFSEPGPLTLKGISGPVLARQVRWEPDGDLLDPALSEQPEVEASPPRASRSAPQRRLRLVALVLLAVAASAAVYLGRTPAARPPEPRSIEDLPWRRVHAAALEGPGNEEIYRAVVGRSRLVAVGVDRTGDTDAAVWILTDGRWSRVSPREALFGGPADQAIIGIAWNGRRFVAVGYDGEFVRDGIPLARPDLDAVVWTSRDGLHWRRIVAADEPALGGKGNQIMNRVTWSHAGWIAVGAVRTRHGGSDAAIWASRNGLQWTKLDGRGSGLGGRGAQEIRGVAAGRLHDESLAVAVGFDTSADRDRDQEGAVWFSPNGREWSRLTPRIGQFDGQGNQFMNSVIATEDGFVVGGHSGQPGLADAGIWTSTNGTNWRRVPTLGGPLGLEAQQSVAGVNSFDLGLIAVGVDSRGGGQDSAVWVSADGRRWTRVPPDENVFGGDGKQIVRWALQKGSRLYALGSETLGVARDAAVWEAELP